MIVVKRVPPDGIAREPLTLCRQVCDFTSELESEPCSEVRISGQLYKFKYSQTVL